MHFSERQGMHLEIRASLFHCEPSFLDKNNTTFYNLFSAISNTNMPAVQTYENGVTLALLRTR